DAMVPFLLAAIMFSYFGLQRRRWQQGGREWDMAAASEGTQYLDTLQRRLLTVYLPLAGMLFFLLFPFYWMATTTFKPDEELYDYAHFNPFWVAHPTLEHIKKL